MDKIKQAGVSTKNYVVRHKTAVYVTLTAIALIQVNKMALRDHDTFLKEHNLYDEFYKNLT